MIKENNVNCKNNNNKERSKLKFEIQYESSTQTLKELSLSFKYLEHPIINLFHCTIWQKNT